MKAFITSLLLVASILNCTNIALDNEGKTNKKHKYGEKVLVLQNSSTIY